MHPFRINYPDLPGISDEIENRWRTEMNGDPSPNNWEATRPKFESWLDTALATTQRDKAEWGKIKEEAGAYLLHLASYRVY